MRVPLVLATTVLPVLLSTSLPSPAIAQEQAEKTLGWSSAAEFSFVLTAGNLGCTWK